MPTHAVVSLWVKNLDRLKEYRELAGDALQRHGGEVIEASPSPSVLDGKPALPDMMVILRFPDAQAARAWIADPELADVHALRRGGAQSDIILM